MFRRFSFVSILFVSVLSEETEPEHLKSSLHQIYLDVKPANTTWHLEAIQSLPLSTYKFSYERSSSDRVHIGPIGPDLAELIPDAVDLIPKRTVPPLEKGGKPITLYNVPVVNEQNVFMYGIGATKELAKKVEELNKALSERTDEVMKLLGETAKLEHILFASSKNRAEMQMRAAAAEAKIARSEMEIEMQRVKDEETYLQAQKDAEFAQIRRNEELTLERLAREEEAVHIRTEKEMRIKLETSQRVEQARLEGENILSELKYERDVAMQAASEEMKEKTAKAIAEAKADAERANEDVHLRKLKAEAEQKRQRHVAAINAVASHLASSCTAAVKNPKEVITFLGYFALLATSVYTAREAARLCRLLLESILGKPKLVRETTRQSFLRKWLTVMVDCTVYLLTFLLKRRNKPIERSCEDEFADVILPGELKERVLSLAISARQVRENNAPHRHVLFYGPPGTGKTMAAKKLAQCIGMDYALMSGGDVSPLGPDAVTQIHNLFTWAKLSSKGVLLFIDEAEAFLGNRTNSSMSECTHNALNALLYNTGSERRDFMLVLATNRAEDLDAAVLDRCDESLLFPLPDAKCRSSLLSQYFRNFVLRVEQNNNKSIQNFIPRIKSRITKQPLFRICVDKDVMNEQQLEKTVKATRGFSGREIGKLMIAIQGAIYATEDGILTSATAQKIIETKVFEHQAKRVMVASNFHSSAGHETGSVQSLSKNKNVESLHSLNQCVSKPAVYNLDSPDLKKWASNNKNSRQSKVSTAGIYPEVKNKRHLKSAPSDSELTPFRPKTFFANIYHPLRSCLTTKEGREKTHLMTRQLKHFFSRSRSRS